ncbi:MAG: LPS export ABC transporter periplasmic protein LptC [Pseudobacteriovorax sp.]|nr:LPS export ABC transporter periplasmic protein LptC [Pseudobacteriovorax sp.]
MGKNIVSLIFVVLVCFSSYIFLQRDSSSLKDQVGKGEKDPRVVLENFTIYRYEGHTVLSTLTGKLAHFLEPNRLEMYGDIRGLRYDTENREYFSSESATVRFLSNGVMQLIDGSDLERAEVENNVIFGSKRSVIKTNYALYLAKDEALQSDVPVTFLSPSSVLYGKNGFEYDLVSEELSITGPMKGTLQSASKLDF